MATRSAKAASARGEASIASAASSRRRLRSTHLNQKLGEYRCVEINHAAPGAPFPSPGVQARARIVRLGRPDVRPAAGNAS